MLLFAGSTPDPLDHLFGWQLLAVLQAIGALRVEGKSGCAIMQVSLFCSNKSVLSCGSSLQLNRQWLSWAGQPEHLRSGATALKHVVWKSSYCFSCCKLTDLQDGSEGYKVYDMTVSISGNILFIVIL